MPKNVDGIKKLSKEELEKSRKIVLDSIGEGQVLSKKDSNKLSNMVKPVDSVFSKKILSLKKEKKKEIVLEKEIKKVPKEMATDFLRPHDDGRIPEKTKQEKTSSTVNQKRIKENVKELNRIISKVNPFQSPVVEERIKKAEEETKNKLVNTKNVKNKTAEIIKKKEKIEKQKEEKQKRREEEKRVAKEEEKKKREDEIKNKQEKEKSKKKREEEKRKEKKRKEEKRKKEKKKNQKLRQEKLRNLNTNLNKFLCNIFELFRKSFKIVSLISFLGLIIAAMIYIAFLFVVIEYNIDNKLFRAVAQYLPIPAYISHDGFVSYYTYLDKKNSLNGDVKQAEMLEQAIKVSVVEDIVLNNLLFKYKVNIPKNIQSSEEMKNILSKFVMQDKSINQVGLTRINKIKDLIKENDDFIKIANKYGDSQDKITLSLESDLSDFIQLDKIKDIKIGEVSEVISDNNGYYIYRCFDKRNNNLYLSYVYVEGKTIDSYIREEIDNYKLWSLVD